MFCLVSKKFLSNLFARWALEKKVHVIKIKSKIMSIAAYTIADNLKTTDLKPEESKPRKRNHQRAGETEDLSPSSW